MFKMIVCCLVCLLAVSFSYLPAQAVQTDVEYIGDSAEIVDAGSILFSSEQNLSPGCDTVRQISLSNRLYERVKVYIRAEPVNKNVQYMPDMFSLSVFDDTGRMCSSSAASDHDGIIGHTFLCELELNENKKLSLRLHLLRKGTEGIHSTDGKLKWLFEIQPSEKDRTSLLKDARSIGDGYFKGGDSSTCNENSFSAVPLSTCGSYDNISSSTVQSGNSIYVPSTGDMQGLVMGMYAVICVMFLLLMLLMRHSRV